MNVQLPVVRTASVVRPIHFALLLIMAAGCSRPLSLPVLTIAPIAIPPIEAPTSIARPADNVSQQGGPVSSDNSSNAPRALELPKAADADASAVAVPVPEPSWDIDVHSYEDRTRVAHYVTRFAGASREYISARLSEGTRYEPMIREEMRRGGIPEDMYYLALVESGFDPNAYSKAAAVGMWQFMSSTAKGMGLRVDWWMDERRDPVKSTRAAVLFLGGLREQFGSIYLAAAAYNGGPGRIARGLTRYADDLDGTEGDDLFFALADKKYLRDETREYVPQIIAAALIAKEPARYGLEIKPQPAFTYDSVKVPARTTLAAVAKASCSTVGDLRELNPQILRGMTPPDKDVFLRIPPGSAATFDSAFAEIPDSVRVGARVVRTKGNETAEKLAKLTGVSPRTIITFNRPLKRSKKGTFLEGQLVYVPTRDAAAAATSAPDPAIERYGVTANGTHVVRKGESLGLIAKHYDTTVSALMRLNGLKKSMIFPGQEILVTGKARKSAVRKPASRKNVTTKKPSAR